MPLVRGAHGPQVSTAWPSSTCSTGQTPPSPAAGLLPSSVQPWTSSPVAAWSRPPARDGGQIEEPTPACRCSLNVPTTAPPHGSARRSSRSAATPAVGRPATSAPNRASSEGRPGPLPVSSASISPDSRRSSASIRPKITAFRLCDAPRTPREPSTKCSSRPGHGNWFDSFPKCARRIEVRQVPHAGTRTASDVGGKLRAPNDPERDVASNACARRPAIENDPRRIRIQQHFQVIGVAHTARCDDRLPRTARRTPSNPDRPPDR